MAADGAQVVEHLREVRCRSSRAELWPYVADTERLNRFTGNAPLEVVQKGSATSAARYTSTTRLGGSPVQYDEEPYEWAEGRYFSFHRDIVAGPMRSLAVRYDLRDADDGAGCVVSIRMRIVPRYAILRPIVRFLSGREANGLVRFMKASDEAAATSAPLPLAATPADLAHAERLRAEIEQRHPGDGTRRLVDHVCGAPDDEVRRMRPFDLADTWGLGRDDVLRLCLDSVHAGLLDLHWDILCPSCRGSAQTIPSLRELGREGHCHFCDITYDIDLDRAVEATFAPHAKVRPIEPRPYCIGGPRLTPHVIAQAIFGPGRDGRVDLVAEAGRYRLFVRGGLAASVEATPGAPEAAAVTVGDAIRPETITVAPGGSITVAGASAEPRHVKLERTELPDSAATALYVSTMPEFRAQFGSEALRPGLVLKVGRVALLFSDLCGSTALYSRVGDAAAFGIVTDCLDYGRDIVERHGGTVVKTMGDAVMAAFPDAGRAVEAGAATIQGWAAFQAAHPAAASLDIKVGVAAGPCTIVTANGILDYFGQTVNTAARLQGQARARQMVISEGLAGGIEGEGAGGGGIAGVRVVERFEALVKGIDTPLSLVRVGLA